MNFNNLALNAAAASLCSKRKVGAVFVHNDKVLSQAYNYHPDKDCSCELDDGSTDPKVIHAEVAVLDLIPNNIIAIMHKLNAISNIYTLYVTHNPCDNCENYINSFAKRYNIIIRIEVVEEFMKFDADKLRYDLIPPSAMKALAEVLTYGAKKYKPNNWRNGDKDRYIAALYRHLEAWRAGEQKDEESGMTHLSHALTNVAFLLELDATKTELDNGHE